VLERIQYYEGYEKLAFSDFCPDETLGIGLPALVLVKGTDQAERRQRLLETYNRDGKFLGRKEMREFSAGFVFSCRLGSSIEDVEGAIWSKALLEPRFADFSDNKLILCEPGDINLIDLETFQEQTIRHPLFGSLHSAVVDREGDKLLIASTGYDSLIELGLETHQEAWRWTAWQNGYHVSPCGALLTASKKQFIDLKEKGIETFYVGDLDRFGDFGLPTAYRTTHVNSAIYDEKNSDSILATFFHQGFVVRISKATGESEILMEGLRNPHGLKRTGSGYIVTDTKSGIWFQTNEDFQVIQEVNFQEFPGKLEGLDNLEWLQCVSEFPEGLFVGVDANRASAIIFDPNNRKYNQLSINPEWSVQSILSLTEENFQKLT